MKITMKYSIGDKVNYRDKEYTIKLWNARIDKDGTHISYSFHAYCDKYFDYHQLVSEDFLNGLVVEPHPNSVDVEHKDAFGNEIELNDTVLSDIIRSSFEGKLYVNADLSFVSYDCVNAFIYEQESSLITESKPNDWISCKYRGYRIGIFNDENGNSLHNGRRYGQLCNEHFGSAVSLKLTDSDKDRIAEMYVNALRRSKECLQKFTANDCTMWLQKEYLKIIDVLSRVKELLDKPKKKSVYKSKRKKEKKDESEAEMWKRIAMKLAKKVNVDIKDLVDK